MKWRILLVVLLVLLVACAPEGSDEKDVIVATYEVTIDVGGILVDVYSKNYVTTTFWFGLIRSTGELKMMGVGH